MLIDHYCANLNKRILLRGVKMKSIKVILSSIMLTISLGLTAGHHGKEVKIYWGTSGFFGPFNIQGLIPLVLKQKI